MGILVCSLLIMGNAGLDGHDERAAEQRPRAERSRPPGPERAPGRGGSTLHEALPGDGAGAKGVADLDRHHKAAR